MSGRNQPEFICHVRGGPESLSDVQLHVELTEQSVDFAHSKPGTPSPQLIGAGVVLKVVGVDLDVADLLDKGVLRTTLDQTFGTINASPWFNLAMAVLFVVLGLAMFDIGAIDFSRFSSGIRFSDSGRGTLAVAFGMGAVAALLAGIRGQLLHGVFRQLEALAFPAHDRGLQHGAGYAHSRQFLLACLAHSR